MFSMRECWQTMKLLVFITYSRVGSSQGITVGSSQVVHM
jgi:hypothetical protein